MRTRQKKIRTGWTLLEMILALALTTLLLSGIYGAMHLYYRGVTTTRANVERDQLARTVLRRVSDDLRSAVRYMPADTSGLSGAASGGLGNAAAALGAATGTSGSSGSSKGTSGSSASSGTSGANSSGSGSSGSGSSWSGSSGSGSSGSGSSGSGSSSGANSSSSTSGESTDTTTAPPIPGVYGTANTLQIDICRLPRPDEIVANANNGTPTSEVRTVYYCMGQGNDPNGLPALLRMEQSRAVSLYGMTNGGSNNATTQVLAAEVASVEFLYFDGTEWLPEWDSTAMGSVPLAIDVRVVMRSPEQQASADQGLVAATAADAVLVDPNSVFRLVVHLPAALTPSGSSSSTTTTDPAASAASSAATTPSTPTSGASSSNSGSSSSGGGTKGGGSSSSGGGTKGGGTGGTKGGGGTGTGGTKGGGGTGTGGTGTGTGGTGTGGTGGPGTGGTGGTGTGGGTTTPTPPVVPPMTP